MEVTPGFDSTPQTAPESFGGSIFDDRAAQNEFFQHREPQFAYGMDPQDGMPSPAVMETPSVTQASLHHPETFVCMADTRSFVLRDPQGHITAKFTKEEVTKADDGTWSVPAGRAFERLAANRSVSALGMLYALRKMITKYFSSTPLNVTVLPIRPQCKHYARQKGDLQAARDVRAMSRICMAQHSETGEYFSLMDSAMYACEMRIPRDPNTETQLDEWDDRLIAQAEAERNPHKFNLDENLKEQNGKSG